MSERFSKDGHVVETSLPREAVRLVAEGYKRVDEAQAHDAPKPRPFPQLEN